MHRLSRWNRIPEQPWTPTGLLVLGCIVAALLALVYFEPIVGLILGGLVVIGFIVSIRHNRRMGRLAASRGDESICTFARSFDRRSVDPWIIRAVYEELQSACAFKGGVVPIRATDHMVRDLDIDGDELDYIAEDIARRAGRSLSHSEKNPWYDRVHTAGDLVHFFAHQPKDRAAA